MLKFFQIRAVNFKAQIGPAKSTKKLAGPEVLQLQKQDLNRERLGNNALQNSNFLYSRKLIILNEQHFC